ncbi:MAG: hypothetical protein ACOCUV_03565 [bacterium]
MSKKKTNKDWESWQEHLVGFIIMVLLIGLIYYFHDDVLHKEATGTKGKVLQHFLNYLDSKFGIEYVYGFLFLIMAIAGIKALRGYSNRNDNKKDHS